MRSPETHLTGNHANVSLALLRLTGQLQVVVQQGKLDLIMNPVFLKLIQEVIKEVQDVIRSNRKLRLWQRWAELRLHDDLRCLHPMNVFDWLVYSLLAASFSVHVADVLQPCTSLHNCSLRLFSVSIIFLWLRLMKHVRAFRLMGPFIVMLGNIMGDVMCFLFLYAEIFIPYACSFWIIFGELELALAPCSSFNRKRSACEVSRSDARSGARGQVRPGCARGAALAELLTSAVSRAEKERNSELKASSL
ncbi:Transient receptor potential cation channel subfamily V member 5 [Dissostichus eleginoides]|uniref:Transient receptor potential cation channel subfamily V member 5 n=1 Tax=Dissostichus eleginoides TaxID=100907 RepID=A0AAD9FJA5_DISEL|nr:Transient receptor potential cation channel subfamily V member 5 [Dissostichus eleginoides]